MPLPALWPPSEIQNPNEFEKSQRFLKGREGELLIGEELIGHGWDVLMSADYVGAHHRSPVAYKLGGAYQVADILAGRDGRSIWVDVEAKPASHHDNTGQWQQGMEPKKAHRLLRLQATFGIPHYYAVIHDGRGLYCPLSYLLALIREHDDGRSDVGAHEWGSIDDKDGHRYYFDLRNFVTARNLHPLTGES